MRLWIIGNGFDLHHGLKSRYSDYKAYLCQHYTCKSKNCTIPAKNLPLEVCGACGKEAGTCADRQNKGCPARKFDALPRANEDGRGLWKDLEMACTIDLVALLRRLDGWAGREPESSSGERR